MSSDNQLVTIEEIDDDEQNNTEEVEEVTTTDNGSAPRIANRNEKKARKALSKLGLKPLPGVRRIVVKRNASSVLFVVNQPEVLRNPGTDLYVIFGVASTGDEQSGLAQAAQQFSPEMMAQMSALKSMASKSGDAGASKTPVITEINDEEIDQSNFDPADIDVVMSQTNVTRAEAVKALKDNAGDIIAAVMDLSM